MTLSMRGYTLWRMRRRSRRWCRLPKTSNLTELKKSHRGRKSTLIRLAIIAGMSPPAFRTLLLINWVEASCLQEAEQEQGLLCIRIRNMQIMLPTLPMGEATLNTDKQMMMDLSSHVIHTKFQGLLFILVDGVQVKQDRVSHQLERNSTRKLQQLVHNRVAPQICKSRRHTAAKVRQRSHL